MLLVLPFFMCWLGPLASLIGTKMPATVPSTVHHWSVSHSPAINQLIWILVCWAIISPRFEKRKKETSFYFCIEKDKNLTLAVCFLLPLKGEIKNVWHLQPISSVWRPLAFLPVTLSVWVTMTLPPAPGVGSQWPQALGVILISLQMGLM